jgi:hypothetical protein
MVCSSSEYKLKKKLGITKDTKPTNEKSEKSDDGYMQQQKFITKINIIM